MNSYIEEYSFNNMSISGAELQKKLQKNVQINAKIDEHILSNFRDVIYQKSKLRKGDFSKCLEESMQEYIKNNKKTSSKNFLEVE